jgi:DNA-binding XRE family transcriptional regulator
MTNVQFIKTKHGEELAVLPRSEYERLVALASDEDVGTARIVRKAQAGIAGGHEIALPKGVVDRLATGENPIRVLREWRGLTQAELAVSESLGITQGYLSDLEAGKRRGPVTLHQKIARALGVPVELLLPIAVSEREANPARFARHQATIRKMREKRGFK